MLSTLATVKSRLTIDPIFVDFDDLLTTALTAISARFDRETNRTLTRTANSTFEFDASDTEIIPPCYPIESVSKFETKSTEAEGWVEQSNIDYLIRRNDLSFQLCFRPDAEVTQPRAHLKQPTRSSRQHSGTHDLLVIRALNKLAVREHTLS